MCSNTSLLLNELNSYLYRTIRMADLEYRFNIEFHIYIRRLAEDPITTWRLKRDYIGKSGHGRWRWGGEQHCYGWFSD